MTAPEFLILLARNSAQAGVLVLLILAAQAVFRRQLTPRWRCALWLLVAVRLLVPVSLNSAASLFNLVPSLARPARPEPVERAATAANLPAPPAAVVGQLVELASPPSVPSRVNDSARNQPAELAFVPPAPSRVSDPAYSPTSSAPSSTPPSEANRAVASAKADNWPRFLFVLWLAGALSMLACLLLSTVVLARRFRPARRVDDPAIAALLLSAQHRLGLAAAPLPIYECDRLGSPALYGCWRPRLLLPTGFAQKFSPGELGYIFLHELAHVRRRDLPVNWLLSLLSAVHWFNPLVWLAFARWRADRELACDALALEAAGPGHNTAYGQTILRLLEGFLPQPLTPGLVGILEDKRLLRQRISAIASFAPRRRWPVLALALTAGLTLVGLTDAQVAAPIVATSYAPAATQSAVTPSAASPVSVAASEPTTPAIARSSAPTTSAATSLAPAKGLRYVEAPIGAIGAVDQQWDTIQRLLPHADKKAGKVFLPVYSVTPDMAPGNGRPEEVAKLTHYYYPIMEGGNSVGTVTIRLDISGSMLGSISFGDMTATILNAVQAAAGLSEVQAGSFEVRLLEIARYPMTPALHFRGLWLKSLSGGTDLIYVIFGISGSNLPSFTTGTLLTVEDFSAKFRALVAPAASKAPLPSAANVAAPMNNLLAQEQGKGAAPDFHYASDAPKDAEAKIREWAQSRGWGMEFGQQLLKDPDKPKILPPIAVHKMSRDQVITGAGLEAAVNSGGFEYFIAQASPIYIHFGIGKRGTLEVVYGYEENPAADSARAADARIISALETLRADKSIHPSDYEVRLLDLPRGPPFPTQAVIGGRVLWLKSLKGGKDLLWPVGDVSWPRYRVAPDRLYAPDELFNALWPERKASTPAASAVAVAPATSPKSSVAALSVPEASANMRMLLGRAERALHDAAASLAGAVTDTHAGFVEKARADVEQTIADVQAVQRLVQANPAIAAVPATLPATFEAVSKQVGYTRQPGGKNQLQMHGACPGLIAALAALRDTPGGDLGGLREKITAGIGQAAAAIISGIEYADRNPAPSGGGVVLSPFAASLAAAALDPVADLSAYFVPLTNSAAAPATPGVPLRLGTVPTNVVALLRDYLSQTPLTFQDGGRYTALRDLDAKTLGIGLPIGSCVFDILGGGLPAIGTETDSLQYTVTAGGKPVAYAMFRAGRVWQVGTGFMSQAIPRALGELMALDKIKAGIYEPRIFSYGMYGALWLKSLNGGTDYIYPVGPTGFGVKARTLYGVDEFVATVRPGLTSEIKFLNNGVHLILPETTKAAPPPAPSP